VPLFLSFRVNLLSAFYLIQTIRAALMSRDQFPVASCVGNSLSGFEIFEIGNLAVSAHFFDVKKILQWIDLLMDELTMKV